MSTPHNNAPKGAYAKTVLMPGDPLRAQYVAENFLTDVKLVNSVRNCLGYTGRYKGVPVSIQASGMGMPSIGIYSYELYTEYDVENIIRIGSAGSYSPRLNILDVVLADSAYSDSSYALTHSGYKEKVNYPSKDLNDAIRPAQRWRMRRNGELCPFPQCQLPAQECRLPADHQRLLRLYSKALGRGAPAVVPHNDETCTRNGLRLGQVDIHEIFSHRCALNIHEPIMNRTMDIWGTARYWRYLRALPIYSGF